MRVLHLAAKDRKLHQLRKGFMVSRCCYFWFGMEEGYKTAFFDSASFLGDDGECLLPVEFL